MELLGLPKEAVPKEEELKRAYKAMALKWHPDRPHNRHRNVEATKRFQAIKDAFEYLVKLSKNSCAHG